ncbi:MAG: hypothetical protein K8S54_03670 [Spirochaetia bacterium]|nr:hypothetical protein [Spirochaetia bacterium]
MLKRKGIKSIGSIPNSARSSNEKRIRDINPSMLYWIERGITRRGIGPGSVFVSLSLLETIQSEILRIAFIDRFVDAYSPASGMLSTTSKNRAIWYVLPSRVE